MSSAPNIPGIARSPSSTAPTSSTLNKLDLTSNTSAATTNTRNLSHLSITYLSDNPQISTNKTTSESFPMINNTSNADLKNSQIGDNSHQPLHPHLPASHVTFARNNQRFQFETAPNIIVPSYDQSSTMDCKNYTHNLALHPINSHSVSNPLMNNLSNTLINNTSVQNSPDVSMSPNSHLVQAISHQHSIVPQNETTDKSYEVHTDNINNHFIKDKIYASTSRQPLQKMGSVHLKQNTEGQQLMASLKPRATKFSTSTDKDSGRVMDQNTGGLSILKASKNSQNILDSEVGVRSSSDSLPALPIIGNNENFNSKNSVATRNNKNKKNNHRTTTPDNIDINGKSKEGSKTGKAGKGMSVNSIKPDFLQNGKNKQRFKPIRPKSLARSETNSTTPEPVDNSEFILKSESKSGLTLKLPSRKQIKSKSLKIHLSPPRNKTMDKVTKKVNKKNRITNSRMVTVKVNKKRFKKLLESESVSESESESDNELNFCKENDRQNSSKPKLITNEDTMSGNPHDHDPKALTLFKTNENSISKAENEDGDVNERPSVELKNTEVNLQQLIEIDHNNKQITSNFHDSKDSSVLFQLSNYEIPKLPKGYIPLVMAPDGKLYPMEVINVNRTENNVSILRPLWDGVEIPEVEKRKVRKISDERDFITNNDVGYGDGEANDLHSKNNDSNNKRIENVGFGVENECNNSDSVEVGFGTLDKVASLQLYMLVKEAKINMRNTPNKVIGKRKYKSQIDYYNRLLEREQLEWIETYKKKRNHYQRLLNKLESGDEMLDFEKDILERKDYELLREDISQNYNNEHVYLDYLHNSLELESVQCLDYASRLIKLKNYLNMERVRLERHKNRLCRINTNKSHSIWNRFVKSGGNRLKRFQHTNNNNESNSSASNMNDWNFNFQLISQNDFMLLTNANSRSYGTYVLNNSMDKGNENQNEIVELIDYFLPEKSTLRVLYKEMKYLDKNQLDKNSKYMSVHSIKKNDMVSKYGLKESNSTTGNRLLKELQIDGMNVDIDKNDRVERRGSGQRKSRSTTNNDNHTGYDDRTANSSGNINNNNNNGYGNKETGSGNNNKHFTNGNTGTTWDESNESSNNDVGDVESGNNNYGYVSEGNHNNGEMNANLGSNSRTELNITSCLDPNLCDIDRVKMLNLNNEEIRINFTKVYGMPKGLHHDEIDHDLIFLRNALK